MTSTDITDIINMVLGLFKRLVDILRNFYITYDGVTISLFGVFLGVALTFTIAKYILPYLRDTGAGIRGRSD